MLSPKKYSFSERPYLVLCLFVVIAYFPALIPNFHIKNDFVTQNLPTRFFISESLYSNTFPWWNPYINFGIPQYGDMNNGFWNPLLWLNAYFFGYDMLTLTIEEMVYIFLGGVGAFKFGKEIGLGKEVSLICAISYMGGGYVIGHLQHLCWITGVAFFPFLLQQFLRTLNRPSLNNFLAGGIYSFLFVSSTHPGLIIGGIYFFIFLFFFELFISGKRDRITTCKIFVLFFIIASICSIVVIASNLEVVKHMTRGVKVPLKDSLQNPTTLQCYLSLLFPFAVHKGDFFHTDISMRNVCIGTVPLLGLFYFFKKYRIEQIFYFAIALLFFILLSSGGWFKTLVYYSLPLLGHVRLNGEFTYFVYILLIFGGGVGLKKILPDKNLARRITVFVSPLLLFTLAVLLLAGIQIYLGKSVLHSGFEEATISNILNAVTFWDLLFASASFQLLCLLGLNRGAKQETLLLYSFINLLLITWGSLPFTGLGSLPRNSVQEIINFAPKGIIQPNLQPINTNAYIDGKKDSIIGSAAFYSKQIGYPTPAPYPVVLYSTRKFYEDKSKTHFINTQPYLFLSTDTIISSRTQFDSGTIKVRSYEPTFIKVSINNPKSQYLVLLQNNYPRWQVKVNGKIVENYSSFNTFLTIKLPAGKFDVEYYFKTNDLSLLALVNLVVLLVGLIYISVSRTK